jgi:hypothetical protein
MILLVQALAAASRSPPTSSSTKAPSRPRALRKHGDLDDPSMLAYSAISTPPNPS